MPLCRKSCSYDARGRPRFHAHGPTAPAREKSSPPLSGQDNAEMDRKTQRRATTPLLNISMPPAARGLLGLNVDGSPHHALWLVVPQFVESAVAALAVMAVPVLFFPGHLERKVLPEHG